MTATGDPAAGTTGMMLPRRMRRTIKIADTVAAAVACCILLLSIYWLTKSYDEWEYALFAFMAIWLSAPWWVHVRLWPRIAWLAADATRREDLILAGQAGSGRLWRQLRADVAWAAGIPFLSILVMLGALCVVTLAEGTPNITERVFDPLYVGLALVLGITALALAGAADVFSRLCRQTRPGIALLGLVIWAAAATGVHFAAVYFVDFDRRPLRLITPAVLLTGGALLLANRWRAATRAFAEGADQA